MWANGYDKSVKISEENNEYPFAGYKEVLNTIYRRIRENDGKRVLDIGFGTGTLAKKLYDDGTEITGIDFSSEMIKIAQEKMPDAWLLEYDFSRGVPDELEDKTFDFIVCTYAIHHLTDDKKIQFIQTLKNHLNDNGEILIGDVAFRTKEEQERCKLKAGAEWDNDEIYIVVDSLSEAVTQMDFIKISDCSGVCVIK